MLSIYWSIGEFRRSTHPAIDYHGKHRIYLWIILSISLRNMMSVVHGGALLNLTDVEVDASSKKSSSHSLASDLTHLFFRNKIM